jgi:alkane 1-monooxygenase
VPPLWFRVMNPRLVRAVGGDPARVNFDPARRARLLRLFGPPARRG